MTHGMWPQTCRFCQVRYWPPSNEIDSVQGGSPHVRGDPDSCPLGTGYFDTAGTTSTWQSLTSVLTFGGVSHLRNPVGTRPWHRRVCGWQPRLDGHASTVPGGIVAQAYEIILDLQVATSADAGWHTVPTTMSPGAPWTSLRCRPTRHLRWLRPRPGAIPSSFTLPTGQSACSVPDQDADVARSAPCDIGAFELSAPLPLSLLPKLQ